MGIYDRDYVNDQRGMGGARPPSGGGRLFARSPDWSVTTWLIVINIVVYVLMFLLHPHVWNAGILTLNHMGSLEVWRLITFQFLHSPNSLMHIGFNMLGLWIFGPMVENYLGKKKYLAYYLTCGLFGGLLFVVLNLLGILLKTPIPGVLAIDPNSPLVGASAGVFGVIVACAKISPNTEIMLLFPPIPMKMKTFAYGYVAIALGSLLIGTSNAGGEAAHVGGAIAGFILIRKSHLLTDFFDVFGDSREPKNAKGKKQRKRSAYRNYKNTDGPHPDEIDAILDKVSKKGFASLSEKDKKKLREASNDA
jgi:membrane associated rhomboid family serine protease